MVKGGITGKIEYWSTKEAITKVSTYLLNTKEIPYTKEEK